METSPAGKPSSEAPIVPPWERVWNEVKSSVSPQPAPEAPKEPRLAPWERFWGGGKASPRPEPPKPVSVAPMDNRPAKPNAQEKEMALAVKLSPSELAKETAFENSPANLAELQKEIKRTKDPAVLAILNQELAKLTKGK